MEVTPEEKAALLGNDKIVCDFICEYCGAEYHGDFKTALAAGWQHGQDASFCPKHNV